MTIQEIQQEIIDELKIFDNLTDKYDYLVKLGKKLPPISSEYKTESNLIKGCQVKTWYYSTFKEGKVFYEIDSLSGIVKGIIVLLLRILAGQKPENIANADLYFIDKSGLTEIFSPIRANSLWKMVNRMKSDAALYEAEIADESKYIKS